MSPGFISVRRKHVRWPLARSQITDFGQEAVSLRRTSPFRGWSRHGMLDRKCLLFGLEAFGLARWLIYQV
jgi:hypothetical protein